MLLKEIGKVELTIEALERIDKLINKQIKKEKRRLDKWAHKYMKTVLCKHGMITMDLCPSKHSMLRTYQHKPDRPAIHSGVGGSMRL